MRTKIDKSNPFKLIYDSNSNIILEQRIKIYTTALGMYKNQRGIGHYYGMCRVIMEALDKFDLFESDIDGMIVYAGSLSNYLPEFKKLEQEFEVNVNEDGYWWDIETDRTPFFEAMIEEATNKSKNINKIL